MMMMMMMMMMSCYTIPAPAKCTSTSSKYVNAGNSLICVYQLPDIMKSCFLTLVMNIINRLMIQQL